MGKHKRKHADAEVRAENTAEFMAVEELELEPDLNPIKSKKVKKHKHKHKRSRIGSRSGSEDEGHGSSRSRSRSPTKSKSKSSHGASTAEEVPVSLISQYSRIAHKKKHSEHTSEEADDPVIAKVLQDMKKGLNDASVGNPGIFAAEELESEDAEIFLIQCPENVNLAELLDGRKLKFGNEAVTSLGKSNDENYETVFLTDENERTLTVALADAFGNTRVVSSKLAGQIVVREAIDELLVPALEIEEKIAHKLPVGLKDRHPVFGTDFSIPLMGLEYDRLESPRKSKSKKKKKQFEEDSTNQHQTHRMKDHYKDFPIISYSNPRSSKRKHAREDEEGALAFEEEAETSEGQGHKKKKKKPSKDEESYVELKPAVGEVEEEEPAAKKHKKKKDKKSRQEFD